MELTNDATPSGGRTDQLTLSRGSRKVKQPRCFCKGLEVVAQRIMVPFGGNRRELECFEISLFILSTNLLYTTFRVSNNNKKLSWGTNASLFACRNCDKLAGGVPVTFRTVFVLMFRHTGSDVCSSKRSSNSWISLSSSWSLLRRIPVAVDASIVSKRLGTPRL